jgi:hypothetical protein
MNSGGNVVNEKKKIDKRPRILNNIRGRAVNGAHTQKNRSQVTAKIRFFENKQKEYAEKGKPFPQYMQDRYDEAQEVMRIMTGEKTPSPVAPPAVAPLVPNAVNAANVAPLTIKNPAKATTRKQKLSPVFPIGPQTSPVNGAPNLQLLNLTRAKFPSQKAITARKTRVKANLPKVSSPRVGTIAPPGSPLDLTTVPLPQFSPPKVLPAMTLKKLDKQRKEVKLGPVEFISPVSPSKLPMTVGNYTPGGTFKATGTQAVGNMATTNQNIDFKRFMTSRVKQPTASKSRHLIYNSFLEEASKAYVSKLPWGGGDGERLFNPFDGVEYKKEDNPLPDIERAHIMLDGILKKVHRRAATLRKAASKRHSRSSSRSSKSSKN